MIDFKAWDSKKAYVQLQDLHQLGVLVKVSGTVEVYNGISSVVVEEVEQIPETESCNRFLFFEDVYQSDVYWETLQHLIQEGCSDNAQFVFRILMDDEEVRNSFRTEFAAVKHHDSCKSGLLAHTTKVVQHLQVLRQYPEICEVLDTDLLLLGAAFHDIGKCVEYQYGMISEIGEKVSHLTYGCLILAKHKQQVMDLMGKSFYYDLLSVISQHHGPYADSPRTLVAYVIHLLDLLDTNLTDIETQLREDKLSHVKTPIVIRDVGKVKYER